MLLVLQAKEPAPDTEETVAQLRALHPGGPDRLSDAGSSPEDPAPLLTGIMFTLSCDHLLELSETIGRACPSLFRAS